MATPASVAATGPGSATLVPDEGSTFTIDGRRYTGSIDVSAGADGLAVVEEVALDEYLAGIREVPFSWPEEALAAQAVAARTYLAWTLARGRSSDGERYDFDICATTNCQVYAGSGETGVPDHDRWRSAVNRTAGQILIHDGEPAQALYSSSAGSRTRAIQDVWGATPKPYLQPVDSPEAGVTPYASWRVVLPLVGFVRIMRAGGERIGNDVITIEIEAPVEGGGPAHLVTRSDRGVSTVPVTRVRSIFNDHGPNLYPELLPASNGQGGTWPQAILSYRFDVDLEGAGFSSLPYWLLRSEDLPPPGKVTFTGEGWGHGVGMSQWGAMAMAGNGVGYQGILGHYYSGLEPADGDAWIPETVRVGLDWGSRWVEVRAEGEFELRAEGEPAQSLPAGDWAFLDHGGAIRVVPPQAVAALWRASRAPHFLE